MTDQYPRDITLNFIIAGKDTSANTLTWFFYMLCKHPLVQEKLAGEVREATEADSNLFADDFAQLITEAALEKMQYLHAALTETLRLYPAGPVVTSHNSHWLQHFSFYFTMHNIRVRLLQMVVALLYKSHVVSSVVDVVHHKFFLHPLTSCFSQELHKKQVSFLFF